MAAIGQETAEEYRTFGVNLVPDNLLPFRIRGILPVIPPDVLVISEILGKPLDIRGPRTGSTGCIRHLHHHADIIEQPGNLVVVPAFRPVHRLPVVTVAEAMPRNRIGYAVIIIRIGRQVPRTPLGPAVVIHDDADGRGCTAGDASFPVNDRAISVIGVSLRPPGCLQPDKLAGNQIVGCLGGHPLPFPRHPEDICIIIQQVAHGLGHILRRERTRQGVSQHGRCRLLSRDQDISPRGFVVERVKQVALAPSVSKPPGQSGPGGAGRPGLGLRGEERLRHPLRPVRSHGSREGRLQAGQQQEYSDDRLVHNVRLIHCDSASWRSRYASRLPGLSPPPVRYNACISS